MKKFVIFSFVFFLVLLMTGCSKHTTMPSDTSSDENTTQKEEWEDLEVVQVYSDRMMYQSLREVEMDAALIVEVVPLEVIDKKVSVTYDPELLQELPGSGYTRTEVKIQKVYKGDVKEDDTITFLHDYYVWEYENGEKQLITISSVKPLKKENAYLLFLHEETGLGGYCAVCDYQGIYPVEQLLTQTNIESQQDLDYIYQRDELPYLMSIYNEVKEKYGN